ncbi:oxidoreductase [Calderihabitans maritimus]|uniref:Coenzyme F420-reducing hydrogenase, gamma subunit n=1 Tax=Calderihabitans maritimus TaxID=1246530 RepID=A0A1Z5HNM2_9FIRM|nr:oxidoreductase [Calderihabitans maritimus]GAW91113.1 coenzyme F420-reducing hydrogenase, gamma subunit [Calderihabitans maritimus]
MPKLNLAVYWTAACGGCDVSILDIDEKILQVGELANIVLWPLAADGKYEDVEKMEDGAIDVCLFNGAIRLSEQEEMARLLRRKSKILIAYGSCACFGGIPGLANFFTKEEIVDRVYKDTPSTDNAEGMVPLATVQVPEGELSLPEFYNDVFTLPQVVEVDYYIPGCPPPVDLIVRAIDAIATNKLPPKGTVIAGQKALCHECGRVKEDKKVKEFKRPHEVEVDPEKCLLEQGIICCGPATRGGCGGRCTGVNMPCRGCFGPAAEVLDEGAKMVGAIASIIDSADPEEIKKINKMIVDPAGTFYRFGLPNSMLRRKRKEGKVS